MSSETSIQFGKAKTTGLYIIGNRFLNHYKVIRFLKNKALDDARIENNYFYNNQYSVASYQDVKVLNNVFNQNDNCVILWDEGNVEWNKNQVNLN